MAKLEYKVLDMKVRNLPSTKVPENLGASVDAAGADGWELDKCVPIMAKGLFGGSYTDSVLLFFRRERRGS